MDESTFKTAAALGAATIHEAQGKTGALSHEVKPLDPSLVLAGRALTVLTRPGDNRALHLALLEAQPGDVLVVDAWGWKEAGAWGDVLTAAAQHIGVTGVVINGAARDAAEIKKLQFPVFAKALSIKGTTKLDAGVIGDAVTIDGVTIRTGDLIVGDADGVVAVPQDAVTKTLEAAQAREDTEAGWVEQISRGEFTADLLGLR
ncbi:RraA family protein [Brevibacterium ravenspurgense]|uniref:RraA family protein n=1 Tax=Brevibacterium ravenspurgense TaxID=479117 RepID=UPI001EF279BA|nr:RraA family protein [Brevibacterium ravenspurgense]MCG7301261.1 RraA family protein [Brevibacterium ravenspurgense]